MRRWVWVLTAGVVAMLARAGMAQVRTPWELQSEEPENIYSRPQSPSPEQLTNQGGAHFSLDTTFLSHYMFRGIDQSTPPKRNEEALQFDGRLEFDLGKLPHPFIGVFSNIFNHDPVSRFEEVRPYGGVAWTIRPVTVAGGFNSYIFPNREGQDTQEAWMSVAVDDSRFWHTERPFLAPYVYGAYDFERYHGFYLQGGVRHDIVFGNSGVTLSGLGDFGYAAHDKYFRVPGPGGQNSGFQHYEGGLELSYDLDTLFNVPRRFGTWEVKGYLFYTGSVETGLRASNRIWGGVGMDFKY